MTLSLWFDVPYTGSAKRSVAHIFAKETLWHWYNNLYWNSLNSVKKLLNNKPANNGWPPVFAASNNSMHRYAGSPGHSLDTANPGTSRPRTVGKPRFWYSLLVTFLLPYLFLCQA